MPKEIIIDNEVIYRNGTQPNVLEQPVIEIYEPNILSMLEYNATNTYEAWRNGDAAFQDVMSAIHSLEEAMSGPTPINEPSAADILRHAVGKHFENVAQ
ncbi:hypothetical protein BH09PAT2_BH09PAT2_07160 [soil metagenome]